MKGDFTRHTFDPEQHHAAVRLQQGRVQLDADWNEQVDIELHRTETEALDLIGPCGAPMHDAAFGVVLTTTGLDADELARLGELLPAGLQPGDFLLSPGRYYVDGILCENEHYTPFTRQADLPGISALDLTTPGYHILYLDAWRRHLTALEAPLLREIALGGPDTATRLRTVWQVRALPVGAGALGCLDTATAYSTATARSTGTLRARAEAESTSTGPCLVPPGAGYRGLENQLYRVEIHDPGSAYDLTGGGAHTAITELPAPDQVKVTGGAWDVGDVVEVYLSAAGADPMEAELATVVAKSGRTLTLSRPLPGLALADQPRLRQVESTFKWSRDNGTVVVGVTAVSGREISVDSLGMDDALGFHPGDWVEIVDHERELTGQPGALAQVETVLPGMRVVRLHAATSWPGDLATVDGERGLRLRRWDGVGGLKIDPATADAWIDLEDGVQVEFDAGSYQVGDYWLIPARTATAEARSGRVEWPEDSPGVPSRLAAAGIEHHYCRLAVLQVTATGALVARDCRRLFPPATEHMRLALVGGDGQECLPGSPLDRALEVGVFNGSAPVDGVTVEFTTIPGGRLAAAQSGVGTAGNVATVVTAGGGVARCFWQLRGDLSVLPADLIHTQQVRARIVSAGGTPPPDQFVRFTANLSYAAEVAYHPGACAGLAGQTTVQAAIERLASAASLHVLSGNGQEVRRGQPLEPLRVLVASACGPITDPAVEVRFEVTAGTGTLDGGVTTLEVPVAGDGTAACDWTLDETTQNQVVTATLVGGPVPVAAPTSAEFTATLSEARHVGFDPADCPPMAEAGIEDVQAALVFLCHREHEGGCCCVTVGEEGEFKTIQEALEALAETADVCICLLTGDHVVQGGVEIASKDDGERRTVRISGCGPGSRVHLRDGPLLARGLRSFHLLDFDLLAEGAEAFVRIEECDDVLIRACRLQHTDALRALLTIRGYGRARLLDSTLVAVWPSKTGTPTNGGTVGFGTITHVGSFGSETTIPGGQPASATDVSEQASRALVLPDAATTVSVRGCDLIGAVHLYGEEAPLDRDEFEKLGPQVKDGSLRLWGITELQLLDNSILRLTVDADISTRITERPEGGLDLGGLFGRAAITGNVFSREDNMFVAENVALATNHFMPGGLVGIGLAATCVAIGNVAPGDAQLVIRVPPGRGRDGQTNLVGVQF